MSSRALLARPLARAAVRGHVRPSARFMSTPTISSATSQTTPPKAASTSSVPPPSKPAPREEAPNFLARYLMQNPGAKRTFLKVTKFLGYGSPRQLAARRALVLYERLCAGRPEEEMDFWRNDCDLPPTFQSWFTVTNLHIWMLTVRLRALPNPAAKDHIQGLIDYFFFDVEERIRLVLSPAPKDVAGAPPAAPAAPASASPSTPSAAGTSSGAAPFYTTRNPAHTYSRTGAPMPVRPAPERLVSQQMKIFKEQWAGLGLALDLALVRGDAELAAALWRNLLGGRGARGITLPGEDWDGYRRSINLLAGSAKEAKEEDKISEAERRDDGSGVRDYSPDEADKYIPYPETMLALSRYVRRELARLDVLPDSAILGPQPDADGVFEYGREKEGVEEIRFGRVKA